MISEFRSVRQTKNPTPGLATIESLMLDARDSNLQIRRRLSSVVLWIGRLRWTMWRAMVPDIEDVDMNICSAFGNTTFGIDFGITHEQKKTLP